MKNGQKEEERLRRQRSIEITPAQVTQSRLVIAVISCPFPGPPVIDQGLEKLDLVVGDTATLTCLVTSGAGNITVSWEIDGKPVPDGNVSSTIEVSY